MSNVLSQEEIDTLLGGLTGGGLQTESDDGDAFESESADAVAFNFLNQDRIVRGGMPTLEVIHDRLARMLRLALTQMVRRRVDVQVLSHMELKFGEFSRMCTTPSSFHTLKMDPLKGHGLLVLPGKLVYTLLDIFFGGTGRASEKVDARDFTLIEQRVISNFTKQFDAQYTEAWKPVYAVKVQSGATETNPQFISISQASDSVIAAEFEVFIDDVRCGLSICLPMTTIEPVRDTLKGSIISENLEEAGVWSERLSSSLAESVIELKAKLGEATLNVEELLNLQVGDIIQLNEDYEHPVEIQVEGVPKFWGSVGSHKSTRAIQITGIMEP